MNRGQIRDLASIWLDDVNNGYFTTTQVNVWINQAQREVQKMLLNASQDYYTKCVSTTTVADQKRYQFPTDFLKVLRLVYISSGSGSSAVKSKIDPITRNEQDLLGYNKTGAPSAYYMYKNTFALVPIPDSTYTLELDYVYRVADLTADAEEPDVPEDYHEYMAILAARDGFLRDGRDLSPIERKLRHYEELFRENAQQRRQDAPRMIVATSGGFGSV